MKKITLKPRLQKYVDSQIKAGRFRSADQMVEKAMRFMMEKDQALEELRASIDEGRAALARGEGIPGSQVTVERIRESAIRRFGPPGKRKAS